MQKRCRRSKFIKRFFYKTELQPFSPFLPFFAIQNLVVGVLFLFGGYIAPIANLKLFTTLGVLMGSPMAGSLWGLALILVFVGHCFEMYHRGRGIGPTVGMVAFLLWCYALYIYMTEFAVMALTSIVAPQLFFWAWYYVESKNYLRQIEEMEVGPPPL